MISVVVITGNRCALLQKCLAGLNAQQPIQPDEIIVVDQNSTDGTQTWLAEASRKNPRIHVLTTPDPSANGKRNRGAALAHSDLIAFLDDDAVPDPDWCHALIKAFENPESAIVTGAVHPLTPGFPQTLRQSPHPRLWKPGFLNKLLVWRCGVSANMAVRRSIFNQLGGFDPEVGLGSPLGGCGDEVDLFLRFLRAGYSIYYTPDAIVRHHQSSLPDDRRRRAHSYYFGVAAVVRRKFTRDPAALAMIPLRLVHSAGMAGAELFRGRPLEAEARMIEFRATLQGWRAGACRQRSS